MAFLFLVALTIFLFWNKARLRRNRIADGNARTFNTRDAVLTTLVLGPLGLLGYAATRDKEEKKADQ